MKTDLKVWIISSIYYKTPPLFLGVENRGGLVLLQNPLKKIGAFGADFDLFIDDIYIVAGS